jgi:hypothetical protein
VDDLESDQALYNRMSQDINPSLPVPKGACFWAGHTLCLAPDGQVSICVISHGRAGIVGNLFTESPEQVVERALAFRARLDAESRACVGHCASCRKPEGTILAKHFAPARASFETIAA